MILKTSEGTGLRVSTANFSLKSKKARNFESHFFTAQGKLVKIFKKFNGNVMI